MQEKGKVLRVSRCFVLEGNQCLILRRSLRDSYNAGRWECPGGKIRGERFDHDELLREVVEETGHRVRLLHICKHMFRRIIPDGKYAGRMHVTYFSIAEVAGGQLRLSPEHIEATWVGSARLFAHDLTEACQHAARALAPHLSRAPTFM
jgi:8-oxo-dGTP pyrophosphatase MutT (NUDIX family)